MCGATHFVSLTGNSCFFNTPVFSDLPQASPLILNNSQVHLKTPIDGDCDRLQTLVQSLPTTATQGPVACVLLGLVVCIH